MIESNQAIKTLGDVLTFVGDAAGGLPASTDEEYAQWIRWVGQKQEYFAVRGFWRRLLTREEITISGDTTVLPDRFHKPNGLYILLVGDVDYADPEDRKVSVEMITDPEDEDFSKWQMRFTETQEAKSAVLWYFAAPPIPTVLTDKLLLPGDMIGNAVKAEYFAGTGDNGSEDVANNKAEGLFSEYLSLEMIPDKSELITVSRKKENRIAYLKQFYYRENRYGN